MSQLLNIMYMHKLAASTSEILGDEDECRYWVEVKISIGHKKFDCSLVNNI